MAASRLIQAYFSYFVDQNSSCLNCNETDVVSHKRGKEREQIRGKPAVPCRNQSTQCDGGHLFPKYFIMGQFGTV